MEREKREREARVPVMIPESQEQLIFHNMQYNYTSASDRRGLGLENLPGMYHMSCTQLLALASSSVVADSQISMDSWVNSWRMESNPLMLNPGSSLGFNTCVSGETSMTKPQYDLSTPHKFVCDLNLTPDEIMRNSQPTNDSGITLDTPGRRSCETDHEPWVPTETESPVVRKRKRAKDEMTTQVKTPQQIQKRKKIRPKVVREGKAKRSAAPKSARKKATVAAASAAAVAEEKSYVRPKRSSRRSLKFDFYEQEEDDAYCGLTSGEEESANTTMQIFGNIPKRKRSSGTGSAEETNDQTVSQNMFLLKFPNIKKKRRTGSNLPSHSHISQCLGSNRPDIVTQPRNFRSLKRVLEGVIPPQLQGIVTEMQPTVWRKKRSQRDTIGSKLNARVLQLQWRRRNSKDTSHEELWQRKFAIDSITELLNQLDIKRESPEFTQNRETALILHQKTYQELKALVPYGRDGSIIPYPKEEKHLPKVDLDAETARVWKLLMVSIDSEGIDGTDEDKQKWWEEERNVFQGRANSFIARMRLVQGDRRFSPWKGSVVDSVIGVFLTQNVADHSSSSAFMDIAAEFPINWNPNKISFHEEWESSVTHETNALATPRLRNQPCIIIHEIDNDEDIDAVCSQETSRISDSSINSAKQSKTMLWDLSKSSIETELDVEMGSSCSDGKAGSSGAVFNNVTALSTDVSEQDTKQQSCGNSLLSFDTVLENNHADPTFVESSGQTPLTDGQTGFFQGISMVSSRTTRCELNLNEVPLEVEKCGESSKVQSMSSHDQELKNALQAQDQEKNKRKDQPLISSVRNHKNMKKPTKNQKNRKKTTSSRVRVKGRPSTKKKKKESFDWDSLRKEAESGGKKRERTERNMDTVDWDALRCTNVDKIADIIIKRGMNNMLSQRMKDFLNRLVRDHENIDLEWLRDVHPDKAKEFLMSINGLGLKSVECVRLLSLHQVAFPVDTNVGRIAVRLGWVPLQPLPDELQMHLLELYPVLESVQKYLWPRLCKLDQKTLYELHYHMITFGKVFCTKKKPNCNACPLKAECRHYASARASARLALPGTEAEESTVVIHERRYKSKPVVVNFQQSLFLTQDTETQSANKILQNSVPIIELPTSPKPEYTEHDIEDYPWDNNNGTIVEGGGTSKDPWENNDVIPTIMLHKEAGMSNDLVVLSPEAAARPEPKLKTKEKLRTEHYVYELPDSHPILEGFEKREVGDVFPYLLAIWTPGETPNSVQQPERRCVYQESNTLCHEKTCFSCNTIREEKSQIVRGTILIPCRTAMRGGFPLNGTYFQTNEVFADHGSSINPIDVPRQCIWNLPRRIAYFGSSVSASFGGLSVEAIRYCFWRGYVCVRGFDRESRKPQPLVKRLHCAPSKKNQEAEED